MNNTNRKEILLFLGITLFISLVFFALMFLQPEWQKPEGPALFIWLMIIWSPNISAFWIYHKKRILKNKLKKVITFPDFSIFHLSAFLPLLLFLMILTIFPDTAVNEIKWHWIILLLVINLIMGPLGEEFGWRGYLYPELKNQTGWLKASLITGLVWALWHAPLWLVDSPQSQIPYWIFFLNVMSFGIIFSVIVDFSGESLIYPVIFHLMINFSSGLFEVLGMGSQQTYWSYSLFLFLPAAIVLAVLRQREVKHG